MVDFISLHNHSQYSILQALPSPKELFARAKELGQEALAISDYGNLAGVWDCYKAAKETGIKYIPGCEFYFTNDAENKEEKLRHVVLLAKNAKGYKNLLLLHRAGFEHFSLIMKKVVPVIDWKLLTKYADGLICLTGCGNGIIGQLINSKKLDEAKTTLQKLIDIFGENLGAEVQTHNASANATHYRGQVNQVFTNTQMIRLANECGVKIIPTCNTHYISKEDAETHDVELAIGSGQPLYSNARMKFNTNELYLKSGDEIKAFFSRNYGEAFADTICRNTKLFADMCEPSQWVDPKFSNPTGKELPTFPVKDQPDYNKFLEWFSTAKDTLGNLDEDKAYLRYVCESAFKTMVPAGKEEEYRKRLELELDTFYHTGISSYMLIVADYVNWARENGVSVGPGRGCLSGNTLVLTKNGYKELSSIKVGEYVYSHTGKLQKVLNTFKFSTNNEDLLEIKSNYSFHNLTMTKDHLVYVNNREFVSHTYAYNDGKVKIKLPKFSHSSQPEWKRADQLNKNDHIFTPFLQRKIDKNIDIIDLSIYNSKNTYKINGKIKRFIHLNNDFMYFLGRWVGDGSYHGKNKGISIVFNINDTVGINKIKNYLEGLGFYVCKEIRKNNNVLLTVSNTLLYSLISNLIPRYNGAASTKHFPDNFRLFDDEKLKSLHQGLMDADGNINTKNTNQRNITSTSKELALQLKELFTYLGKPSSICHPQNRDRYGVKSKDSFYINTNINNTKYMTISGFSGKITHISKSKMQEYVYDITVEEDHSYLTTNGIVHNSVGGCLVGYLLKIHSADPIKYGLVLERFYNKLKTSLSDIDMDFSQAGREKVIKYITNKYGKDNVAQISNINKVTPKVFIKDLARSLQMGGSRDAAVTIGNTVADYIPKEITSIEEALKKCALFAESAKRNPDFIKHRKICNKPRAVSQHAAGLIIGSRTLSEIVPVRTDKNGAAVVELDKDKAEEVGLVKMDLLGLETLDIIDLTYDLIRAQGKEVPEIDVEAYDQVTYDLISKGDTLCVFQFGTSAGTVELCRRIKPKSIEDLAIITAIARPVSKAIREDLINVKNGKIKAKVMHPSLERAMKDTYGFSIYDESLLILSNDVAGWDLAEADKLRKLTKEKGKNPEKAKKWREEFIEGAIGNKIDEKIAIRIWEEIVEPFGSYGFNKSLHFNEFIDIYDINGKLLSSKPISEIEPGDIVRSRDENTKLDVYVKVKDKHDHGILPLVEVELKCGKKIRCTMNHKFRTKETGEMLPVWKIIEEKLSIYVDAV